MTATEAKNALEALEHPMNAVMKALVDRTLKLLVERGHLPPSALSDPPRFVWDT